MLKIKSTSKDVDNITLETWKNQIKTDEKIEKLSAMVEELKNTNIPKNISSQSGTSNIVKISGKLLEVLMPTITPSIIDNNGIF